MSDDTSPDREQPGGPDDPNPIPEEDPNRPSPVPPGSLPGSAPEQPRFDEQERGVELDRPDTPEPPEHAGAEPQEADPEALDD